MINYVRRNRDPYSWSYHDDLIAARMGELRYHVSLGVGAIFDDFLDKFYSVASSSFSPIYFLSGSETESRLPMIGMISPDVGILRLLGHPLAGEFISYIPWIYRDTFFAMQLLPERLSSLDTLPDKYKSIEDIRWVNHKIARRSMLDEVIQQLAFITLNRCWEAIPSELDFESWVMDITQKIHAFGQDELTYLELLLPCNEALRMPMIIFWLQLLEGVIGRRYKKWRIYWSDEKMVLMKEPHEPHEMAAILLMDESVSMQPLQKKGERVDPGITLKQLLSCWGEKLKLQ